jgi:hypothetical protein
MTPIQLKEELDKFCYGSASVDGNLLNEFLTNIIANSSGMINPMTALGDMIYGGTVVSGTATPASLPLGTAGWIIRAGASAPNWFNLFGTANIWTNTQTIGGTSTGVTLSSASSIGKVSIFNGGASREARIFGTIQYISNSTITAPAPGGGGGSSVTLANSDSGYNIIYNNAMNQNNVIPILSYYNRNVNSYGATVPTFQIRNYVGGVSDSFPPNYAGKSIDIMCPSNTGYTTQSVMVKYDIFQAASYRFLQNYSQVSIDDTTKLIPTALLHLGASTTNRASLCIATGTAPTSPNDGDIWYNAGVLYIQVGATTKTFNLTP